MEKKKYTIEEFKDIFFYSMPKGKKLITGIKHQLKIPQYQPSDKIEENTIIGFDDCKMPIFKETGTIAEYIITVNHYMIYYTNGYYIWCEKDIPFYHVPDYYAKFDKLEHCLKYHFELLSKNAKYIATDWGGDYEQCKHKDDEFNESVYTFKFGVLNKENGE